MAVAASDGRVIYTGGKGIARTRDGGGSWTTFHGAVEVHDLAVAPADPQMVYVGAKIGCLSGLSLPAFRSDDGGQTLTPIGENRISFALHPQTPRRVFAASCGFLRSDDGGRTWAELPDATPTGYEAMRIGLAASDPQRLYAVGASEGGSVAVRTSGDGGATWREVTPRRPDGNPAFAPAGLAVASAPVAYLATWDGIWTTQNAGQSWSLSTQGLEVARTTDGPVTTYHLSALAVSPSNPSVVYVGTAFERNDAQGRWTRTGFGVFRSTDAGKTWAKLGSGLDGKPVRDLTISPDGRTLYAATNEGLYRLALSGN